MDKNNITLINLFLEQTLNKKEKKPDGFYGDFFNTKKYPSIEEAKDSKDFVSVFTGKNEDRLWGYFLKKEPTGETYFIIFDNQDPRFGEDYFDNERMLEKVYSLLYVEKGRL